MARGDREQQIFAPGADSGTYDFMVEDVLDLEEPTQDYNSSEDDNIIDIKGKLVDTREKPPAPVEGVKISVEDYERATLSVLDGCLACTRRPTVGGQLVGGHHRTGSRRRR